MRYRPFGITGQTISAVTLALGERPDGDAARVRLVYAALEAGISGFELRNPAAAPALGQALQALERRMVAVTLRIGGAQRLDRSEVLRAVEQPLLAGRLVRFDAIIVEHPLRLTPDGWEALAATREASRVRLIGVAGEGMDEALRRPEPDLLCTAYHLGSVWSDRNRMLTAVNAGRTVVGEGYHPQLGAQAAQGAAKRGLFGLGRKAAPIERTGGYEFLRGTPNWAADEICLAYALTEPSLASIVLDASTPEDVERLAAVPEREMPAGLAAQIEMARFAHAG